MISIFSLNCWTGKISFSSFVVVLLLLLLLAPSPLQSDWRTTFVVYDYFCQKKNEEEEEEKQRVDKFWQNEESILPNFHSSCLPFSLLSLRVCSIWKKCVYCTTAKLSSQKRKKSAFSAEKSLVGSTPGVGRKGNERNRCQKSALLLSQFYQNFTSNLVATFLRPKTYLHKPKIQKRSTYHFCS